MRENPLLFEAVSTVPPGAWAVGVSGGADSVALLCLLHDRQLDRGDVALHVVHLDHETRGPESAGDAAFVAQLAAGWSLPCTIETRSHIEAGMACADATLTPEQSVLAPPRSVPSETPIDPARREYALPPRDGAVEQRAKAGMARLPTNASARYRAARLALFGQVIARHNLAGVLLAHHADDQAETALIRLLRGSGPGGLAGMSASTRIDGVTILRPLLSAAREQLRSFLLARGQTWREDASNESPKYLRNRVRTLLAVRPDLRGRMLEMASAFAELRDWVRQNAPALPAQFEVQKLRDIPDLLAREAARRWLTERGAPPEDLSPRVLGRLLTLARDAAAPPRCHFPGALLVRRRRGMIFVHLVQAPRKRGG